MAAAISLNFFYRVYSAYARTSERSPHKVAAGTACSVLSISDATAQLMSAPSSGAAFDWERWRALVVWGTLFYGGPCRLLYSYYDRWWGSKAALRKAAVDVFGNGVFLMVPSFYMTTGILKGETVEEAASQLRTEWVEASTGTCAFWLPTCAVNFALIPPHSRILSITICSFLHKTWLSLLSNASRVKERQVGAAVSIGVD